VGRLVGLLLDRALGRRERVLRVEDAERRAVAGLFFGEPHLGEAPELVAVAGLGLRNRRRGGRRRILGWLGEQHRNGHQRHEQGRGHRPYALRAQVVPKIE
jgi:hypothetical protein